MEQNTINHNRPNLALQMKHVALGITLLTGLTGAYVLATEKPTRIATTYPVSKPSEYGISAIKIDGPTSGQAVLKLDGFYVYTSFDFQAHKGDYGVPGSETEIVDITNLAIDRISSINGHEYNDFTTRDDVINIKNLVAAYIEKNNLAGGV